jgi:hypothetical protein
MGARTPLRGDTMLSVTLTVAWWCCGGDPSPAVAPADDATAAVAVGVVVAEAVASCPGDMGIIRAMGA